MSTWAILATGPSMSQEIADYVRGRCPAVAVSDAYRLAPWAEAMVSNDVAWWLAHPEAQTFPGKKYSSAKVPNSDVEQLTPTPEFGHGSNSGLQALRVAHMLGATRILLLGFDMRGAHFFGNHKPPLRNTTPARFEVHIKQFQKWRACPVINCTPGSALKQFPFMTLEEALAC